MKKSKEKQQIEKRTYIYTQHTTHPYLLERNWTRARQINITKQKKFHQSWTLPKALRVEWFKEINTP